MVLIKKLLKNTNKAMVISNRNGIYPNHTYENSSLQLKSIKALSGSEFVQYENINIPVNEPLAPQLENKNDINIYNVTLTKTCDKKCAMVGDTITYKVLIKNSGDLNALNVIFKDKLPHEVSLVEDSFTINSNTIKDVNLLKGVFIGTIAVGQTVVINYKVKIVCGSCKIIKNYAIAKFNYALLNGQIISTHTSLNENNSASFYLSSYIPKEILLEDIISVPFNKPIIENINYIDCKVNDLRYSIIANQIFIEGILKETLYCKSDNNYIEHYIPFNTYIDMPSCPYLGELELSGLVLSNDYNLINPTCIKTFVRILLSIKEKC